MQSDMIEPKETDVADALKFIFEESWPAIGDKFFRALVRHLAIALGVRYVYITECTDSTRTRVRTLASWVGEDFGENIEYNLAGTPCENVMKGKISYYPKDVQALFPRDEYFITLGVQSYLGIPFFDSSNRVIGHMGILDTKPMNDNIREVPILKTFAARAGVELERKQAEVELKKYRDDLEGLVDQRTIALKTANEQLQREITEREKIEEKLRVSEKKYRGLTESLGQLVYRANPNTFVATYVNNAIKKIYGYTVEKWLKNPDLWEKAIHPDDKERVITGFTEAQQKFEDSFFQYRIIKKDGSICQVEDHFTWEKDEQGKVISLNGVMYDITERKQAEEELQTVNEQLDAVIFNMPIGVAILEGPEFKYAKINRTLADINGLSVKDHIGRPLAEVIPQAAKDIIPRLKKVWNSNKTSPQYEFSTRLPKDHNHIKYFLDSFFSIGGKNGKVKAIGVIVLDITNRKESELILKESHDLLEDRVVERTKELKVFKNLINQSSDAIFVIDPKTGRFLDVNNKVSENLGYSRKEILKMKAKDIGATIYDDQSWQKTYQKDPSK